MILGGDAIVSELGWVVPIVALIGVIGQWGVGAFYAGRMDERVHGLGREIRDIKIDQRGFEEKLSNHEGRIAHIEGRKGVEYGG